MILHNGYKVAIDSPDPSDSSFSRTLVTGTPGSTTYLFKEINPPIVKTVTGWTPFS